MTGILSAHSQSPRLRAYAEMWSARAPNAQRTGDMPTGVGVSEEQRQKVEGEATQREKAAANAP